MKTGAMTVAGIMSGTSADGVDVALVRIEKRRGRPALMLLAHEGFPYPAKLRRAVLGAMNAASTTTAELARLNWRLALAYADAVRTTIKKHGTRPALIGCHGQTLFHQGVASKYAGRAFGCTWQAGEAAVLAQELGIPVVSNFRPADMAAGGQGAPLVPLLDYVMFADGKRGRVLQNIGGIANLTAIPRGAGPEAVIAFDTGPGNMVMDALTQELLGKRFDRNGAIAARGVVLTDVLRAQLRDRYYAVKPPRSTGREQFGREFATRFLSACRRESERAEDALATATALTAESIALGYAKFAAPLMRAAPVDYIVSGGGARNATLMAMLAARLEPMGCLMAGTGDFGLPVEAKEAAAFALMAWYTWHRMAANLPAATGAKRAVILGQVTYV